VSRGRSFGSAALALLCFSVVYLPLEEFLLKWAPGGSIGYAVLRLAFELLLFLALGSLLAGRVVRGLRLRATPLDGPLLLFTGLATASLFLSDGSVLQGLINLRVLLRYVAVFYLVVYLELAPAERRLVLVLLLCSAAVQAGLGLVQASQGGASDFWLPRSDLTAVAGVTHEFAALGGGLEQGAVLGTTDHSVAFALFLLVAGTLAAALLLAGAVRGWTRACLAGLIGLALGGIVFSYVRSCLFALGLTLLVLAWRERRSPSVRRLLPPLVLLAPVVLGLVLLMPRGDVAFVREKETHVSPLESVGALFTSEYMQASEGSRLWVLRDVGAEIARSAGWLGFGPDEEHVKECLLRSGGATLYRLVAYRAFEDVYWVALLAYYGFLGLAVFLVVLARLVPAARQAREAEDPWERAAGNTLFALLVVVVPLSFLTPTFDFRTFAFPFWMLAGMAVARTVRRTVPAVAPARVPRRGPACAVELA
jgi:hypothetical protein